jgi:hypothetical protein
MPPHRRGRLCRPGGQRAAAGRVVRADLLPPGRRQRLHGRGSSTSAVRWAGAWAIQRSDCARSGPRVWMCKFFGR